jgi:ribosomal protein S15P/S13E
MGSSLSAINDIIDEYGSWENYMESTGAYERQYKYLLQAVTNMKKDFEQMMFKDFVRKYYVEEGGSYRSDITAYVKGEVIGPNYFKTKKY